LKYINIKLLQSVVLFSFIDTYKSETSSDFFKNGNYIDPLYTRLPNTNIINPTNSNPIAAYLVFSQAAEGLINVTMRPTPQTITVLVTSTSDLAKEETYFVTETPVKLKTAIVIIPIKTKARRVPLWNIS